VYYLGDQVKDEMSGTCSTDGRNAYNILVGKPEGTRKAWA